MNRRRRASFTSRSGFSLVEMLVALLFTMILMAGMATIFRSSLSSAVRSSDQMSNTRRNRMSMDVLSDDINNTALNMQDLSQYKLPITTANPGYYIVPNVSYAAGGLDAQVTYPTGWAYPASTGDQLYLYFDDPLPFDATLDTTVKGQLDVENDQDPTGTGALSATMTNNVDFNLKFSDASQASAVLAGMTVVLKDTWDPKLITSVTATADPKIVAIRATGGLDAFSNQDEAGTPTGTSQGTNKKHLSDTGALVFNASQQVRYSIQNRALDPSNAARLIPCLVREQGAIGGAFTTSAIIAENVIGFKAYISADMGVTWAGMGYTQTRLSGDLVPWNDLGASGKFRKVLDTSLSTLGRPGHTDTTDLNWFREIPVMMRLDILTRTMTKRAEYGNQSPTTPTAEYATRLQTLIFVPRHSGLPLS